MISNIPNNLIKIWRTDKNGIIKRYAYNKESLGVWTLWEETETGN